MGITNATADQIKAMKEELFTERVTAWQMASNLVAPVVDQHGLMPTPSATTIFASSGTRTPVDQHVGHIQDVAEWLMGKDD